MEQGTSRLRGISELAEEAGVTPRTVRYYVAEGLLPPPGGAGQQRVYADEHLLRLRAIKRLKAAYLPLDEIRRRLSALPAQELQRFVEEPEPPPPSSALDYLASVLAEAPSPRVVAERPAQPAPPRLVAQAGGETAAPGPPAGPAPLQRAPLPQPAAPAAPRDATDWRRVVLAPGVELHYQPSGDPRRQVAIMRVIQQASTLLAASPPDESP